MTTQKKTPASSSAISPEKCLKHLESAHPDAGLELNFSTPLELLIALILAAQCTDERVNKVTETLFRKYRKALDFVRSPDDVLEEEIRPTGFYRNKARAIRKCCAELVDRHGGEVPGRLEELVALPGVGRKTANIVLGNAFGVPAIGVDTHVKRLSIRMGFTTRKDPDRIEEDLCGIVPRKHWVRFCHLLQVHGRRMCKARKPQCAACPLQDICPKVGV